MLEVTRSVKTFDLEPVAAAVSWALERAQAEDRMNAAKNLKFGIEESPLTRKLREADELLGKMRTPPQVEKPPKYFFDTVKFSRVG